MISVVRPPGDAAIIRGAPDTPGCASHAKRWVLIATILGSSVAFLEGIDHQRRAAGDPERTRRVGRGHAMDRQRVHAVPRRAHAGRRRRRRPLRSSASVPLGHGHSRCRLARLRRGGHAGAAHRRPRDPGHRRGAAGSEQPCAAQRLVPEGRARPSDRHLVGVDRAHRRGRADSGRLARRHARPGEPDSCRSCRSRSRHWWSRHGACPSRRCDATPRRSIGGVGSWRPSALAQSSSPSSPPEPSGARRAARADRCGRRHPQPDRLRQRSNRAPRHR